MASFLLFLEKVLRRDGIHKKRSAGRPGYKIDADGRVVRMSLEERRNRSKAAKRAALRRKHHAKRSRVN
jgi:hypothetical protein